MARTNLSGPLYVGGRPVIGQDLTTGELVGPEPIVYPPAPPPLNGVTQDPLTHELLAPQPIAYPAARLIPEGEYRSLVLQTGGPSVDVPRNVSYGPGGLSLTGIASVLANGEVDILKDASVVFSTRLRAQRTGAAGVSIVVIWGELSIDGGVNWIVLPNVSSINLSVADDTTVFYDVIPAKVLVGQKYRVRFARSSAGNNSGDLAPQALPGPLAFLSPVPSAYLSLYRFA
jgi:hypothetical protein